MNFVRKMYVGTRIPSVEPHGLARGFSQDAYKNGTGVRGVHQELEMLLSKALFAAGQKIEV